jgi:hypothetical protein
MLHFTKLYTPDNRQTPIKYSIEAKNIADLYSDKTHLASLGVQFNQQKAVYSQFFDDPKRALDKVKRLSSALGVGVCYNSQLI